MTATATAHAHRQITADRRFGLTTAPAVYDWNLDIDCGKTGRFTTFRGTKVAAKRAAVQLAARAGARIHMSAVKLTGC